MASVPVFAISKMPKSSSSPMRAEVLLLSPKIATVRDSLPTSMMLARNRLAIWMTSSREARSSAFTLMRANSRWMEADSSSSFTAFTGMSFRHWAAIWEIISSSASSTMVMRVMPGRSVAPETMDSMLYPLRENRRATWLRTPGVSSTRIQRV